MLMGNGLMNRSQMIWVTALLAAVPILAAAAQSIPDTQIDKTRILFGTPAGFEKAAEVDMDAALQATPEFQEIVKKKVDHGTGKYWILVSEASDRVHRAIGDVGRATEYDLIAEKGYLGKLDPPVDCEDITAAIVDRIHAD